ncbi:hypothetical protein [Sorangium sp. So ce1389]|uniref:hypothetical protein n=1 Tax=Sorangium sp. So ce1389 TaxID=3133336 RepID=UPI003F5FA54F
MLKSQHESIQRICSDLGLPEGDSYTQDWAYELPEEFRTEADFYKYLNAYTNPTYGDPERHLLMDLALDVANDLLQQDEDVGKMAWHALTNVLRMSPDLHRNQIEYWVAAGEDLEDAFALTPLIREFCNEMHIHIGERHSSGV